jgi:hypothetical protein
MNIDAIILKIFNENKVPVKIQKDIIYIYNLLRKDINTSNPRSFNPSFSNNALKDILQNKELKRRYKQKIKILNIFGTKYVYNLNNQLLDKIENYYVRDDPYTNATTGTLGDSSEMQKFLLLFGLGLLSYGIVSGLLPLILAGIGAIVLAGLLALIQSSFSSSSSYSKGKIIQTAAKEAALTINTINDFSNNTIDELIIDNTGKPGISNNIGHIVIDPIVIKSKYNIFDILIKNTKRVDPKCENINCNFMVGNTRVFANNPCCINPYSRYQPLPEINPPIEVINSNQDCRTYCDGNNRIIECINPETNEVIHRQYFQDNSGCCNVNCNPNTNTWIKTCGNINPTRNDTGVPCSQQYKI